MTTMHQRQRMRDRHQGRDWHDTVSDEAQRIERALGPRAAAAERVSRGVPLMNLGAASVDHLGDPIDGDAPLDEPRNERPLWAYFCEWIRSLRATWRWLRG